MRKKLTDGHMHVEGPGKVSALAICRNPPAASVRANFRIADYGGIGILCITALLERHRIFNRQ